MAVAMARVACSQDPRHWSTEKGMEDNWLEGYILL